jgi:anthranilate phosphoribosyltransferase
MPFARYIREIGRGEVGARSLTEQQAYELFGAMLDGGVPDLELGAILLAMRVKTESLGELLGFHQAATERLQVLRSPSAHLKPIVIPTYNGARHQPNLLPLLALVLQRFGIPVMLHGTLEGYGRVATAYILRELGIMPQPSLAAAQKALDEEGLAFVPTAAIAPGLANLMGVRHRLGLRNSAHTIVKLIEPFVEPCVRMVSVSHPAYVEKLREFFTATAATALLMRGTEGEAFANPKRRPQIEYIEAGRNAILFEAEVGTLKVMPALPESLEAVATAKWTRDCLAGRVPVPYPIVNQLACCLFVSGYTDDMNQAKAIAAVEAGSLAAA